MAAFRQKLQEENPLQPGPGQPPLLAGRVREQEASGTQVAGLPKKRSTLPFAIYGPRGMGKTSLLDWVQKEYGLGTGKAKANLNVRGTGRLPFLPASVVCYHPAGD